MKLHLLLPGLLAFCFILHGCGGGGSGSSLSMISDDFTATTLFTPTWGVAGGSPTVSADGWLVLNGAPGGGDGVQSHAVFGTSHRMELSARATQWAAGTSVGFKGWGADAYGGVKNCAIVFTNNKLVIRNEFGGTPEWSGAISPALQSGRTYKIEIRWAPYRVELLIDGQVKSTYVPPDASNNLIPEIALNVRLEGSSTATDQLSIDYVNVLGL